MDISRTNNCFKPKPEASYNRIQQDTTGNLLESPNDKARDCFWVCQQLEDNRAGDYETKIMGSLLHAWACIVGDPGARATGWIFEGAPAGLEMSSKDLDGMFPSVEDDELELDDINLYNY